MTKSCKSGTNVLSAVCVHGHLHISAFKSSSSWKRILYQRWVETVNQKNQMHIFIILKSLIVWNPIKCIGLLYVICCNPNGLYAFHMQLKNINLKLGLIIFVSCHRLELLFTYLSTLAGWKTGEGFTEQSILCIITLVTMASGLIRDLALVQMSCFDYYIITVLPREVCFVHMSAAYDNFLLFSWVEELMHLY